MNPLISTTAFADNKPHYNILDGLRGVAAIVVIWYHIFEGYATSRFDQIVNHGYLAVDFFFILSGFVVAYAYDDRWKKITTSDFLKRRLIRLQPMVLVGAIIGGLLFYATGCEWWNVSTVAINTVLIALLFNLFLIPIPTLFEVRGFGEIFPLNGPTWSLFFEYIGNVLYGFFIRRFSTTLLAIFVITIGFGLSVWIIFGTQGGISYGWQLGWEQMIIGFFRMLFSFSLGLFMSRIVKAGKIKGAFLIASIILITLLVIPRLGNENSLWINGIYEVFCIALFFPLLVYIGISGTIKNRFMAQICKFLGDISYPLYIIHYPFIYLYIAWIKNNNLPFSQSWHGALAVVIGSIILAYFSLKLYDIPIRKYLINRF